MSEDIQLDVIYTKIKDTELEETKVKENLIEKEEVSIKLEENDESERKSSDKEESCCEKKKKKINCFRGLCACIGLLTTLSILVYTLGILTFMIRMHLDIKQCFDSKENSVKQSTISAMNIENIHFDVLTGFVYISYHNESTFDIKLWDKARTKLYVDEHTFDSGIVVVNNSIRIHSYSPAFTTKSCHHASVEIYIPNKYPKEISITGNVQLGYVVFEGSFEKKSSLSNINIAVEMGIIDVSNTILTKSLSLKTELGSIVVSDVITTESVKLQTHIGSIRSNTVLTKKFYAMTYIGCSCNHDIVADFVELVTQFGYTTSTYPQSFGSEMEINMKTGYGRSYLKLFSSNLTFDIATTKGKVKVSQNGADIREGWNCTLLESTHNLMNGNCSTPILSPVTHSSAKRVHMKTQYGVAKLNVINRNPDVVPF